MYASRAARVELVRLLLSKGADVEGGRRSGPQGLLPGTHAAVTGTVEGALPQWFGRAGNAFARALVGDAALFACLQTFSVHLFRRR